MGSCRARTTLHHFGQLRATWSLAHRPLKAVGPGRRGEGAGMRPSFLPWFFSRAARSLPLPLLLAHPKPRSCPFEGRAKNRVAENKRQRKHKASITFVYLHASRKRLIDPPSHISHTQSSISGFIWLWQPALRICLRVSGATFARRAFSPNSTSAKSTTTELLRSRRCAVGLIHHGAHYLSRPRYEDSFSIQPDVT